MGSNVEVHTSIDTSKNITSSMNYVTTHKPHDDDNGQIKHRVLAVDTQFCSTDKKTALHQFRHLMKLTAPTINGKRSVQCIREIKSFKGLDYHNPADQAMALRLNHEMMKLEHQNSMVYSVLQCDGKSHLLHVHNIISPINMKTGKSTTSTETSWYRAVEISNKVMKNINHKYDRDRGSYLVKHNADYIPAKKENGGIYHIYYGRDKEQAKTNASFIKTAKEFLLKNAINAHNMHEFADSFSADGASTVSLNFLRHHKVHVRSKDSKSHLKKVITEYNGTGNNLALAYKLKDGKYGRIRKTWLITSNIYGNKIRTSRLGPEFQVSNIIQLVKLPPKEAQMKVDYIKNSKPNRTVSIKVPNLYGRNDKQTYQSIKKRFPHYTGRVPQFRPLPVKPHVSTIQAYSRLANALKNASRQAVSHEQQIMRQQEVFNALSAFAKKQQEQALKYAEYQDVKAWIKNYNQEQRQLIELDNKAIALNQFKQEQEIKHRINRGSGWSR